LIDDDDDDATLSLLRMTNLPLTTTISERMF